MIRRKNFDKYEWMLTRERFGLTDVEPPTEESFVSIRDVLGGLFKKIDSNRCDFVGDLEREWDELAGGLVKGHARPGGLRGQSLLVYVDSSVWLNELIRYKRAELLVRLQKRFGADKIKSIFVQLDPDSAKGSVQRG